MVRAFFTVRTFRIKVQFYFRPALLIVVLKIFFGGGMEKYFTVEELAKYLNYAEKTIYKWVLNEEIPYFKINQTIRFRLSDIEKWLDVYKKGAVLPEKKITNGELFAEPQNTEASELPETETGEV